MSNLVFPSTLNGYVWDCKKKPVFNNITHSPPTGRDVRISLYEHPIYEFTLSNQWLSKTDKDLLMNFFKARRGSFDSFLYSDEESIALVHPIYIGDGVTTTFQLSFLAYPYREIVNNFAGSPLIYLGTTLKTLGVHYTISPTGLITFVTAPVSGVVMFWSGTAYYRCIFLEDSLEYNQFADRLYDCNEIKFKGSLAAKL
jgi:hypothetical protein